MDLREETIFVAHLTRRELLLIRKALDHYVSINSAIKDDPLIEEMTALKTDCFKAPTEER